MKICIALPALFSAAAFAHAAEALGSDPLLALPLPMMTVVRTPKAPKIDGKLADNEWRYATSTAGFLNLADGNLAEEKTVAHVTFDGEKLYFAFQCARASERAPAVSEIRRDGGVYSDESIEVHLLPPGADEKDFFHLVFNSRGTIFDRRGSDVKWDAHWQIANDAGMGYWNAEVAVPFADLGVKSVAGQTWRINFARSAGVHTSWSFTGRGYLNPPRWGEVRFVESGVIAKVSGVTISDKGESVVDGALFNSGEQLGRTLAGTRQPAFDVGIKSPMPVVGTAQFRQNMRPNLQRNELNEFHFAKATRDDGRKLLQIGAATEDGTVLYRQAVPWQPKTIRHVELLASPDEQTVFVRADPRGLSGGKPVDVQVKAALRGGPAKEIALTAIAASGDDRSVNIAEWPAGTYDCSYRLSGVEKTLAEGKFTYERVAPPEWQVEGAKLGRAAIVPKPWTPIRWSADAAETWGRTHRLGGQFILEQINSSGVDLLSGPITLEADAGGATTTAKLERRKSLRSADHEGAWESTGSLGAWRVALTTAIEFDGMMRFDLDLSADTAAKLDGLRLVIPLPSKQAKYFHHAASYYALGASGTLPAGGLRLGFWPFVWLGDDRRGLMWFAESAAGWHSDETPIEVKRAGEVTQLIIHFVDRAETVARKQLTFGLQATPVKPVPPDWREWRVETARSKRMAAQQIDWEKQGLPIQWRMLSPLDGNKFLFSPGHSAPLQATDALGEYVKQSHAKGTRLVPYLYLHGVSNVALGVPRYYPLWQTTSPRQMAFSGTVLQGACAGGPFADYMLYGIEQWVKKYQVDGVYFDGAGPPVPCANPLHGHGWLDASGKRQPSYAIFGLRDFYKRLWIMLSERVADPVVWVHADGKMPAPCFSFVTANYEGEFVQGPLLAGDALLSDLLPPDFWRSHEQATQWGVVPIWLPKLTHGPTRARQQNDTLATLLVHGTPCAKPEQFDPGLMEKIWKAQHAFGIGQANFHGYWENAGLIKVEPVSDRILASFYERDGRIMLIVANLTDQDERVEVQFQSRRAKGDLADVLTGETIAAPQGSVNVTVSARSFRLLTD